VAEALAAAQRTGERCWEAELHRMRGDLLLKRDAQKSDSQAEGEAEACFRRAIEIAQQQQARSWELSATTNLARFLAQRNHCDEVRTMLVEVYSWFTEGFDTSDLKEAKALLDELSRYILRLVVPRG
jgi:predicted ATPase